MTGNRTGTAAWVATGMATGGTLLHRLSARVFGWHPPPLARAARAALGQGRSLWQAGDRAAARAAFARAAEADMRVFCHDWGILPGLAAAGQGSLKARLDARLAAWYGSDRHAGVARPPEAAALAIKARLRPWAERHGFATPRLIAAAPHLDALDWPALRAAALSAQGLVIKPANQSTCKGVAVLAGGTDHMARAPVGPDPAAYMRDLWARAGLADSPVLVEERLCDDGAGRDPSLVIPRDIKVYAVAGQVGYAVVLDRNAPGGKRSKRSYDGRGRWVPHTLTSWPEGAPRPAPPGLGPVVAEAMRASRLLPQMLRFDFYHTAAGPVLGEITTYPTAGLDHTWFSRRTLLQMWEVHPD